MRTRAAMLSVVLLVTACRATDGESRALSGSASTPTPAPTAGQPAGLPAAGYTRVIDEAHGWSIDRPSGWFESPASAQNIGFRSYIEDSTVLVPDGGVSVRMHLQSGDAALDLEAFADRYVWTATCAACRRILERADLMLAGQPAKFFSVYQNQPEPFDQLEPRLFWLVRSPFYADRALVIIATPAASPHRAEIERVVATLQFFRPAPVVLTPTRTRAEALDLIRSYVTTFDVVQAKLVLWRDWERTYNSILAARAGGPTESRAAIDPDALVWVVMAKGEISVPFQKSAPGRTLDPSQTRFRWWLVVVPAREPLNWAGPSFGGREDHWPAPLDALVDLGS